MPICLYYTPGGKRVKRRRNKSKPAITVTVTARLKLKNKDRIVSKTADNKKENTAVLDTDGGTNKVNNRADIKKTKAREIFKNLMFFWNRRINGCCMV